MSIANGIQSGIISGIKSGINSLYGLTWPTTGAELATAMGVGTAPVSMWRGNEASNATDLVASNNLTDVSTPTHLTENAYVETSVGMSNGALDRMDAASNSVLDITTGSVACLWVGQVLSGISGSALMGKFTAGSVGYGLRIGGGSVLFLVGDGVSSDSEYCSGNPRATAGAHLILGVRDTNSDNVQCFMAGALTSSSPGGTNAANGSLTNTDIFAVGRNPNGGSQEADFALAAVWTGAGAEQANLNATGLANLKASLGL